MTFQKTVHKANQHGSLKFYLPGDVVGPLGEKIAVGDRVTFQFFDSGLRFTAKVHPEHGSKKIIIPKHRAHKAGVEIGDEVTLDVVSVEKAGDGDADG